MVIKREMCTLGSEGHLTSFSVKNLTRIKMEILVQNESFKRKMAQQPSQTILTCTSLGLDLG